MKGRTLNRRAFLARTSASLAATAGAKVYGQSPSQHKLTVGDDSLRISIEFGTEGLKEATYFVEGQPVTGLRGLTPWSLELDGGTVSPAGLPCELRVAEGSPVAAAATFEGRGPGYRWRLDYSTWSGRITKWLRISPETDTRLIEVALWKADSIAPPRLARTKIQEFAAFYRDRSRGLFVSLDFPYSRISSDQANTTLAYRPYDPLLAGEWYACHSLTIGATRLTGNRGEGFDRGEIEAFDAYVQRHQPPRFEKPMNVYASIVNRYTQVHDDTVFYSMRDQPTLAFHTELVERDLELMPKLGMEYYQVFPGAFEWAQNDPRNEVARLVRVARERDLRIGDYSATTRLYSPHFNIGSNRLNRPEWLVRDARGAPVHETYCFGNPEFERYYSGTVVSNCRRYGFEMHCLDLLKLTPCYAPNHGHPLGSDSLYHQVRGLLRMIAAVNAVAPQMMTWPNSGDWLEILPKLAWYSENLYLTDPFIKTPWQGLNMTRLLDDARREQMVVLHHDTFLPYRFFTNCQYFFSQNSVVPDIRNYEYGALSTLAVTPNLCLGEFRPWLDSLSPLDQNRVFAFYQRWTKLIADYYPLWKQTWEGGERPGFGSIEVYSHAAGNHGFVFLVNPNYWDRTYELALDKTLGFGDVGRCEVVELYPVERLCLTAQGAWPGLGTRLPVNVPAQSVTVFEIRPAPDRVDAPLLYGVPGTAELTEDRCRVKTQGPQGRTETFAVMLPPAVGPINSARVLDYPNEPDPRLAAPTPLKLVATRAEGALVEITFRRQAAPTHLSDWKVRAADLDTGMAAGWRAGLPQSSPVRFPLFVDAGIPMPLTASDAERLGLGPAANFCGAYIENAFSENQETWIELSSGGPTPQSGAPLATAQGPAEHRPLRSIARAKDRSWWFGTTLNVPFLYQIGAQPSPAEHTLAVFPLLRANDAQVIRAWINGAELPVQNYAYPRNRKLGCYYADLVGSAAHGGKNLLVIHLRF